MSLYRQAHDRRWRSIAIVAALAGLLAAAVLIVAGGDDGSGGAELDAGELDAGIERLSSAIELVELHYGRSVENGDVVDEALYASVNDQLDAAVSELSRLGPAILAKSVIADRRISVSVSKLEGAIADLAPVGRVRNLGAGARAELANLTE